MNVHDAIKTRRTIYNFKPDPVLLKDIERILSGSVWAPNHKLTEPWRFAVVTGKTKERLAEINRSLQMDSFSDVDPEDRAKLADKAFKKVMSKPTIIVVSCCQEGDEQRKREDYAATCCAIQNIMLGAWEMEIGMQWSTGKLTRSEETYKLLSTDSAKEYIVGFLYTGYPSEIHKQKRKPLSDVTSWWD